MPLKTDAATRKDKTTGMSATLQHRHFAFIAATLSDLRPATNIGPAAPYLWDQWRDTVKEFARVCAMSNSRFDRDRFFKACQYE